MKDYLFLFRGGLDFSKASPEQLQLTIMNWKNWTEELLKKGIYGGGERLTRNDAAVVKGNAKQVIDGPYTESKEIMEVTSKSRLITCSRQLKFQKAVLFLILTEMLK
jgi:hypothetical protein